MESQFLGCSCNGLFLQSNATRFLSQPVETTTPLRTVLHNVQQAGQLHQFSVRFLPLGGAFSSTDRGVPTHHLRRRPPPPPCASNRRQSVSAYSPPSSAVTAPRMADDEET